MSSAGSSLERAVAKELGEKPGRALLGVNATAEQIDLKLDEARETGKNVFRLLRQEPGGSAPKRGRPEGAGNKQNADIAKLLAHKGIKDPVEYLAEIYNTPLDQLCALALAADGTSERQAQLDTLIGKAVDSMDRLSRRLSLLGAEVTEQHVKAAEELRRSTEELVKLSAQKATKPGDVAIKLINAQIASAKAVAEYWHSKRPVEAKVQFEQLPTIFMPGAGSARDVNAATQDTQLAANLIAGALKAGALTPESIHGLTMQDGKLVREGEYVEFDEVEDDGGDD